MAQLRVSLPVVSVLILTAAGVLAWRVRAVRRSPTHSLEQLAKAVHAKDRRAAERYIDVHRVAESVVDDAVAAAASQGATDTAGVKPSLVTTLEQTLWEALTESPGAAAGGPWDPRTWSERYQGIEDVQERGDRARVGVRLRLEESDAAGVVHLSLERVDGYWRLVAVEDLARLAQPAVARTNERASEAAMKSDLRNLVTAEEMYRADHGTYTTALQALTFDVSTGGTVAITAATRDGWSAVARHEGTATVCRIAIGNGILRGSPEAQPQCSP